MKVKRISFNFRLFFMALAVIILSAVTPAWCGTKFQVGGTFIPFKIKTLDGKVLDLGSLNGRPIVINFFASWCTECRAEARWFGRQYLAFRGSGVEFLGIAVQDTEEDAKNYMKEFGLSYPAGLDDTGEIARKYGLYGIPKTYIVGKDGRFSFIHTGELTEDELAREIKKALLRHHKEGTGGAVENIMTFFDPALEFLWRGR